MSGPRDPEGMPDVLTQRVEATPDRTAMIDATDGTEWRYEDLAESVTRLAGALGAMGLDPGDHLGLVAGTSMATVRLIHAAWRHGLVLVPLNVRLDEGELGRQLHHADLDAVVCATDQLDRVRALTDLPAYPLAGLEESTEAAAEGPPAPTAWARADPILLLYTSGTTGSPKAVTLTMGNLLSSATASAFRLGVQPGDRWLLCLPIYHMGGLAPVFRAACYGTALVVQPGFDPAAVATATHEHDVSGVSLVPTMLRRLLDTDAGLAPAVDTVLLGGAPAPPALLERCWSDDVPVYPTYGLTETASQAATASPEQARMHEGTVGQPLFGTTITVVDANGDPLPPEGTGELVVDGPTVTPGYYADPEATAAAFGDHGLRTGDRGYRDEAGRLWVLGRVDDVIVTGGEKVQPSVVAAALRSHPDVDEAAVVGIEDPEWGQRVVALVVPTSGAAPTVESLTDYCRGRLADFQVPKTIAFAAALPRTASGTVDRPAVRRRFAE